MMTRGLYIQYMFCMYQYFLEDLHEEILYAHLYFFEQ